MRKLWVQLTLAFSLVTLIGVAAVALLANWQVSADFRSFVAQSQLQDSPLADELRAYYAAHGNWDGAGGLLSDFAGARRGAQGRGGPAIMLADAGGRVVAASAGIQTGIQLAPPDLAAATPLIADGRTAGYLLVRAGAGGAMSPAGQQFLARVNWALLQAGLLAGGLGLLLGLLIARGLAAPLKRLSDAAHQIAQGKLGERVPLSGAAEIADLARAFNEMAAGLQQSEQLRQHMIADVAHELRTPLTVIQGNLRAILDDVYPLEKAEIAAIYDETLLLSRLMTDLRELAQAEAGQLNLTLLPTDITSLVQSATAPFEAAAAAQGVTLVITLPDQIAPVYADADRVRQVLQNLIANALRYTPHDGTITIATAVGSHDDRSSSHPQSFVTLCVRDTGSGIAAADVPHVFERFWRADRSRSREHGGSGLGLAIAKQIVEAQGGRIGVESAVREGSQFWFTLPVADAMPPAASSSATRHIKRSSAEKHEL